MMGRERETDREGLAATWLPDEDRVTNRGLWFWKLNLAVTMFLFGPFGWFCSEHDYLSISRLRVDRKKCGIIMVTVTATGVPSPAFLSKAHLDL